MNSSTALQYLPAEAEMSGTGLTACLRYLYELASRLSPTSIRRFVVQQVKTATNESKSHRDLQPVTELDKLRWARNTYDRIQLPRLDLRASDARLTRSKLGDRLKPIINRQSATQRAHRFVKPNPRTGNFPCLIQG